MKNSNSVIDELCNNLQPVKPMPRVNLVTGSWFLMSLLFVVVFISFYAPIRTGAFEQLISTPRFFLETLLGITAIVWVSTAAFRDAIPGRLSRLFMITGSVLMVLWLGQYAIGLIYPTLEPSSLGKRDFCYLETFVYGIAVAVMGQTIIYKYYPLNIKRSVVLISLASGMIPALYMQLACMYKAPHILLFHILPGLMVVFVGLALSSLWFKNQTR